MPAHYMQVLERTLEPLVAEFIRLVLLFTAATSIALVVLAAVLLGVYLIGAWREAHGLAPARRFGNPGRYPALLWLRRKKQYHFW